MGKSKKKILMWVLAYAGSAGAALGMGWLASLTDKLPSWMTVTTGSTILIPALTLLSNNKKVKKIALVVLIALVGANAYMWLQQFGIFKSTTPA